MLRAILRALFRPRLPPDADTHRRGYFRDGHGPGGVRVNLRYTGAWPRARGWQPKRTGP